MSQKVYIVVRTNLTSSHNKDRDGKISNNPRLQIIQNTIRTTNHEQHEGNFVMLLPMDVMSMPTLGVRLFSEIPPPFVLVFHYRPILTKLDHPCSVNQCNWENTLQVILAMKISTESSFQVIASGDLKRIC